MYRWILFTFLVLTACVPQASNDEASSTADRGSNPVFIAMPDFSGEVVQVDFEENQIGSLGAFTGKPEELDDLITKKIDEILATRGIQTEVVVKADTKGGFKFAVATTNEKGDPIIAYDPVSISNNLNGDELNWLVMSILAHEVGHHLNGHMAKVWASSNPSGTKLSVQEHHKMELEADAFSGGVIFDLYGSLSDAKEAVQKYGRATPSSKHPDKLTRLGAVEKGWESQRRVSTGSGNPSLEFEVESDTVFATLQYDVVPNSAEVFLDGDKQTENPISIVPGLAYDIEFRNAGYESVRERLRLEPNETKILNVKLKSLDPNSEPSTTEAREPEVPDEGCSNLSIGCLLLSTNMEATKLQIINTGTNTTVFESLVGSGQAVETQLEYGPFYEVRAVAPRSKELVLPINIKAGDITQVTLEFERKSTWQNVVLGILQEGSTRKPILFANAPTDINIQTPNGTPLIKSVVADQYAIISDDLQNGEYRISVAEFGIETSNILNNLNAIESIRGLSVRQISNPNRIQVRWQNNNNKAIIEVFSGRNLIESTLSDRDEYITSGSLDIGQYRVCVSNTNLKPNSTEIPVEFLMTRVCDPITVTGGSAPRTSTPNNPTTTPDNPTTTTPDTPTTDGGGITVPTDDF